MLWRGGYLFLLHVYIQTQLLTSCSATYLKHSRSTADKHVGKLPWIVSLFRSVIFMTLFRLTGNDVTAAGSDDDIDGSDDR